MGFGTFKNAVMRVGAKAAVKLSDKAPTILVVGGTLAMVGGTIVAIRQTSYADEILEDHKQRMSKIVHARKISEDTSIVYSPQQQRADTVREFFITGGKFAKLYSPAIILEVVGIVSIFTGHHILNKRHLAMAASYAGLQKSYSEYRERIVKEYGDDADFRALTGAHKEVVSTLNEDGTETTTEYDNAIDPEHIDMYSVLFDEMYSGSWTPNAVTNMAQIKAVEEYFNSIFEQKTFIYYWQVLRELDIWDRLPEEKQRLFVGKGWVWGAGDNHISLGIFDINKPMTDAKKDFIMGYEPSVLIVPNLDGDVASLL